MDTIENKHLINFNSDFWKGLVIGVVAVLLISYFVSPSQHDKEVNGIESLTPEQREQATEFAREAGLDMRSLTPDERQEALDIANQLLNN